MTRRLGCNFGVVISASHNLFEDNGIKFFDGSAGKLSDQLEEQIEAQLAGEPLTRSSGELGRARRVDNQRTLYQEFCRTTLPDGVSLAGLKIVVDCANGAAYKVAPRTLADLGADIVPIGSSPNGRNINVGCGSTAPELLQLTVPGVHAQVGIALDGDGDRLLMVDHLGRIVDGDQLLFIIACARHVQHALPGPVVGTLMSNLGLELALRQRGIAFERAPVGDRYVLARLRETGGVLGGETSGHILCLDRTTTGDGLVSALQVLAVMQQQHKSLAELAAGMTRLPQVMLNVKVAQRFDPLSVPAVKELLGELEAQLGARGRIVLRASGTEPLIRVMVEAQEESVARGCAERLAAEVRAVGG
jgi:phosphoglucosamine mutase